MSQPPTRSCSCCEDICNHECDEVNMELEKQQPHSLIDEKKPNPAHCCMNTAKKKTSKSTSHQSFKVKSKEEKARSDSASQQYGLDKYSTMNPANSQSETCSESCLAECSSNHNNLSLQKQHRNTEEKQKSRVKHHASCSDDNTESRRRRLSGEKTCGSASTLPAFSKSSKASASDLKHKKSCAKSLTSASALSTPSKTSATESCKPNSDVVFGQALSTDQKDELESACTLSCANKMSKDCKCHFPPAYSQFACTGQITGSCNCDKKNCTHC